MKRLILALSILAAAITGARATSIYSDNFDYSDGGLIANSGGHWVNNSGTAGSLLVTNVGANTLLRISGSLTEDGMHLFPSAFPTNDPTLNLYASFQLTVTNAAAPLGTYFATFGGTNVFQTQLVGASPTQISGHRGRLYLSSTNLSGAAPAGTYFIAIANSFSGSSTNAPWPTPLNVGATYTVVERLNTSNDVATLWINPSSESDPSVTATDIVPVGPADLSILGTPSNGVVNICMFGFRQSTGEGTNLVDALKVGTAFVDVAGANTAPSITGIGTQSIPMNGVAGPINFTVSDSESPATSLTVVGASSNPTLITTGGIALGGSGSVRTVTLTPNSGQQGSATITLTVSDGVNQTPTSFLLQVGFPTIGSVSNVVTYSNLPPVTTTVTVGDAETGAGSVSVSNSVASVNQSLISSINVTGSGATRTVTITPAVDQTGSATITLYARDPQFNLVQTSFVISVSPKYGVLLSDDFSYNSFSFATPSSLDGADGTQWSKAGSSAGVLGEMQVTNGYVVITSSNTEDVSASLLIGGNPVSFDPTNGVLLYASFDLNPQSLSTPLGDYFAHFQDTLTGTTFRGKIYSAHTNAVGDSPVADGAVRIGIANAANNANAIYPMDVPTNTTVKVVVRLNAATGETVLWVNPNDETSASVAATDPTTGATVGAFGLRESDFEGTLHLDNLKIGTQFTDVFTPIPQSMLTISVVNGQPVVSWSNPSTFYLLAATNLQGAPFKYVSNGVAPVTSPYTVTPTIPATFYRTVNVAP